MNRKIYIGIAAALLISIISLSFISKGKIEPVEDIKDSLISNLFSAVDTTSVKPQKTLQNKVKRKAKPLPPVNLNVRGLIVDTDSMPMSGVVVSDGYTCVTTDIKGEFSFKRNTKARFIYYTIPADCEVPVHSATDNTACFYLPVEKGKDTYNFVLKRLPGGKEKSYRMIVIGDPQITNAFSPYYIDATDNPIQKSDVARFTDETMTDIKRTIKSFPQGTAVYGLSMGDDVQYYGGYNPLLESQIRAALGSSSMKVFSVIGNHDQDGSMKYERKWEESWGPTDYSFDRGDVHYVCFNNVHFTSKGYYQPGELSESQLKWLASDLSYVDKSKKVVLNYHIPLTFGNRPKDKTASIGIASEKGHYHSSVLHRIMALLESFEGGYELFCGHTHFAINHEIDFEGRHILEHCHAAACGNIWQSNINICGTPNGYYVYSFGGTRITNCYYKGTFWNASQQMALFFGDTDFNEESYASDWDIKKNKHAVIANVFNADSRWKVVAIENGVEHPMTRISSLGQDAFAAGYHHKYSQSVSYHFVSKKNGYLIMNHLYYYEPESADARITVKATDPYGKTYIDNSSNAEKEPFFNYAHYYKENEK